MSPAVMNLPSLEELRAMPTHALRAYAESADDEAAWDELSERVADASYGEGT